MPVHRFLLRRRWLQLLDGSTVATAEAAQSSVGTATTLATPVSTRHGTTASSALAATAAATEPTATLATPVSTRHGTTASSALAATTLATALAATMPAATLPTALSAAALATAIAPSITTTGSSATITATFTATAVSAALAAAKPAATLPTALSAAALATATVATVATPAPLAAALATTGTASALAAAASVAACSRWRVHATATFAAAALCPSQLQRELLCHCRSRGSRLRFTCQLCRRGTERDERRAPNAELVDRLGDHHRHSTNCVSDATHGRERHEWNEAPHRRRQGWHVRWAGGYLRRINRGATSSRPELAQRDHGDRRQQRNKHQQHDEQ